MPSFAWRGAQLGTGWWSEEARARDGQGAGLLGLLFIDIDNFTYVNDLLGHDAGDRVLAQFAERLQDWPGAMGDLFRLGGDEFVYLLEDIHSPSELKHVCERVLARIQEPVHVDGKRFDMRRIDWFDLRNMLTVAQVVTQAALARTESRGAHQREDYPGMLPEWRVNQVARLVGGRIELTPHPVPLQAAAQ